MIRQIVTDKENLRELLYKEIRMRAAPQFTTTEEELNEAIRRFFKENYIKTYPIFIQFDVMFVYRGFNVDIIFSSCLLTKEEMQEYLQTLNKL
jgi:hypothetical protein